MSLKFPCGCGRLLQVGVEMAGKRVRCPACSAIVWAPAAVDPIPEARLVDPEVKAVPGPAPAAAEAAKGAAAAAGRGATCCTPAGFVLALGSLVFGVVTMLFPVSWPAGGLLAAVVSCRTLRRIRAGAVPASAAPLARAGFAIGLGQAALGTVVLVALATTCLKGMDICPRSRCGVKAKDVRQVESREIRIVPAQDCATSPAGEQEPSEK